MLLRLLQIVHGGKKFAGRRLAASYVCSLNGMNPKSEETRFQLNERPWVNDSVSVYFESVVAPQLCP